MTCNQWDIVVIPFPFVDSPKTKPRPVLILSNEKFCSNNQHSIAAMITSSNHQRWIGDTEITDLQPTGLRKESIIRLKLFTIDMRFNPRIIGTLADQDRDVFHERFTEFVF